MFISLRISLNDDTTEDRAEELARSIASHLGDVEEGRDMRRFIDKTYYSVDEGDGNDLGL